MSTNMGIFKSVDNIPQTLFIDMNDIGDHTNTPKGSNKFNELKYFDGTSL